MNNYDYGATCPQCREITVFHLTPKEHKAWIGRICYGKQTFIQDIFPNRTPAERELLRGGMCGKCWDNVFGCFEEEDGDDE